AERENRLANEFFINTGKNSQQRAFARTVETKHADLRAVEVREINIFEDGLLVVILADADHRVDNFVGNSAHFFLVDHRCCARGPKCKGYVTARAMRSRAWTSCQSRSDN